MTSSRREFLKRGTWMALAAGVPLSLTERVSGMEIIAPSDASGFSKTAFESQLNTKFLIKNGAKKVTVTLTEVENFASRKHTAAGKEGFSLRFRGPQATNLKQNTYLIEHKELGMFSLLLVPIGRDKRTPCYEAVINRLYP